MLAVAATGVGRLRWRQRRARATEGESERRRRRARPVGARPSTGGVNSGNSWGSFIQLKQIRVIGHMARIHHYTRTHRLYENSRPLWHQPPAPSVEQPPARPTVTYYLGHSQSDVAQLNSHVSWHHKSSTLDATALHLLGSFAFCWLSALFDFSARRSGSVGASACCCCCCCI